MRVRRWPTAAAWGLASFMMLACGGRNRTGELKPPNNAPAWEQRYRTAFDDDYTKASVELSGRAPHDVLDQRLFAARLGHAQIVAVVRVQQVWGKGRYQGRKDQYLDVVIERLLIGELMPGTDDEQLLRITGEDELPGSLQGQQMVLFVRWAPREEPPYHHHLMPADEEIVAYINAMVQHAQAEGILDAEGRVRKRVPRKTRKRAREEVSTDDELP